MKRLFLFATAALFALASCEKDETEEPVVPHTHQMELITKDTIWKAANNPHVIKSYVKVSSGTLTIEPGVVVKFDADGYLEIGGTNAKLLAVGTIEKPILFTSNAASKQTGDWRSIAFKQGAIDSKLEFCNIEYGGSSTTTGMVDVSSNALVSVNSCNLSNAKNYSVVADDGNGFALFTNNTVTSTTTHAMELHGRNIASIGEGNTFTTPENYGILVTDNGAGYVYITTTGTWRKINVPYYVEKETIVKGGATLTIEAGNIIKFMATKGIRIGYSNENGTLVAKGTEKDSIYFTSASASPQIGDWKSLDFEDGAIDCELQYCSVSYGGSSTSLGMINVQGTALLSVKNCKISNAKYVAVEAESVGNGFVAFQDNKVYGTPDQHLMSLKGHHVGDIGTGNTFYAAANYGIRITGAGTGYAYVDTDDYWRSHNVPYYVEDDIYIRKEATLTIQEGAEFRFYNGTKLLVGVPSNGNGKLVARGTQEKPIVFTTASASPQKGDWNGIEFSIYTLAGSELSYCNVNYGGNSKANVLVYSCGEGNPTISNCTISNSKNWGIYKRKSSSGYATPTLSNNTFSNNTLGDTGADS